MRPVTTSKKNIYTIHPEENFLQIFAELLFSEAGGDYFELAKIKVFLPNQRTKNALREEIFKLSENKATMLPKIYAIGEADEDELQLIPDNEETIEQLHFGMVKDAISKEQRNFLLAGIIRKSYGSGYDMREIDFEQAYRLASSLGEIIDDSWRYEIPLKNLKNIAAEELAKHNQVSLNFIKETLDAYTTELADLGLIEAIERRNLITDLTAKQLEQEELQGVHRRLNRYNASNKKIHQIRYEPK
jgi:ATP-dependent helicase/nuclease subunit B